MVYYGEGEIHFRVITAPTGTSGRVIGIKSKYPETHPPTHYWHVEGPLWTIVESHKSIE